MSELKLQNDMNSILPCSEMPVSVTHSHSKENSVQLISIEKLHKTFFVLVS